MGDGLARGARGVSESIRESSAVPLHRGADLKKKTPSSTINLRHRQRNDHPPRGLTPKRVTVSVGVPYAYYEKIWKERNPPVNGQARTATPTEMETLIKGEGELLRTYIAKLLPLRDIENPDKTPITDVVINTFQQITQPELPETQFSETALLWARSNSSTIATGVFALIGLLMLRGLLKGVPAPFPLISKLQRSPAPQPRRSTRAKRRPLRQKPSCQPNAWLAVPKELSTSEMNLLRSFAKTPTRPPILSGVGSPARLVNTTTQLPLVIDRGLKNLNS